MSRLLLASILVALIALPIIAARAPDGRRGLRRAVLWVMAYSAAYAAVLVAFSSGRLR